jgi:hypothetical protein
LLRISIRGTTEYEDKAWLWPGLIIVSCCNLPCLHALVTWWKLRSHQVYADFLLFAVLLLKWRPTYPKLASQNASIASDLGTWQTASCILGVGLCLKELLEEESPGSICSCRNCSLEYVKSQHLASYRHWSYDKQVLEYRKSQFAATVTFSWKNALQNARHLANCLLRPCAALCNRTYSRTCLRHQVCECQTKLYVLMQWMRCLWFSLRCYRLLQGCHMMPQGARVVAASR